jgi:hypothetical protein
LIKALHYEYSGEVQPYIWCPETEAMRREIKCGGGWPSGSDGDWCKVWWLDWTGWKWRQGVWDPDQGYCIITSGQAPNNGCTDDRRESTASGIADLCGGNTAGDGKCEQACGADASCDEKDTGDTCGTNGRCASYCLCCEASDSDGGEVYTIKGTTSGYYQGSCQTFTDYCSDNQLVEFYISDRQIAYHYVDCARVGTNGNVRCIDGKCGCLYDSDCPSRDGRKGRCDPTTHTCKWDPCRENSDCDAGYCCEKAAYSGASITINPPYGCVSQGTIKDNKYLCDPPEWNGASKQTIFDLLFSHFKSLIQKIMG